MPRVVSHIDIDASIDAVWDLLMQPARYSEIADPTDEMLDIGDGEVKKGYVYRERGGIPPFKSESTWQVTAFEPKSHQVHEGDDGQMRFHLDIRIAPSGAGSRLTQTLDLKPRWYMVPMSAVLWPLMMRRRAQAAMDKTVANVRRIVEVESAG